VFAGGDPAEGPGGDGSDVGGAGVGGLIG